MTRHDAGKKSTRQGTLARARRKNNEVDVDGRIALGHIHQRMMANNDVECMLARVEGNGWTNWCAGKITVEARFGADHKLMTRCQSGRVQHVPRFSWKGTLPTHKMCSEDKLVEIGTSSD